jgi:uncharacterized protein YciI
MTINSLIFSCLQVTHMQETSANTPEKKYFLLKLIAPRPDFATTMTAAEMKVMQDHGAYLIEFVERGSLIVMGPVLDPKGAWGMAVFEAGSEEEVRAIIEKDPTVLSGLGFTWEFSPMLRAVVRK